MSDRVPMTPSGYESLKQELRHIKTIERPKNVKDIETARAHGDISENAEFHAAKERQGQLEARIAMIDDKLARAQVIDTSGFTADDVRFGATVLLCDSETDEEVTYTIVGEDESDVSEGKISIQSPVARAIVGKQVDDEVTVRAPKGTRVFEIREIHYQ